MPSASQPHRLTRDDPRLSEVLTLIRGSFTFMDGRIDPPSSMHRLTETAIQDHCDTGEVWTVGRPVTACIFLMPQPDSLYIGKLAVAETHRGQGLAHQLVTHAETRARARGLTTLMLETRIELVENHAAFARLGFSIMAKAAHPGYARPTFVVMHKAL
ncbi:MAG: GNAT family N-acetyltransferase [Pseudomonadota bacterium]